MFSEAEGNEVLLGLRKGSAKMRPQQGPINTNKRRKLPSPGLKLDQTQVKPIKDDTKVYLVA